ncbi:MAG TPA: alpha/beta family hydrolase [Candidatus Limnocylindria bacterium]|nr:alpha/beta family hydrolase [Candidatus Limnocylindria bacterium]
MPPPTIHLAHGASGSAASMRPYVEGLRARGLSAEPVQLPRSNVERAVVAYRAAAPAAAGSIIGGHSFGGRVASLLAAEDGYAALILLSYPLHAPGRHDSWRERTSHWPRITCPVLLLSGDHDPFARIDLLRDAVQQLTTHELVVYEGVRHGIGPRLEDALDRIAGFANRITEAVHSGE